VKPLSELTKNDIKNIKLVCFDVDGVTIKKGTDISEVKTSENTTLTVKTSNLSEEMRDKMIQLKKHFFISVSSGRSSLYLTKIYAELLWDNCALISENGIFTLLAGKLLQHEYFDPKTLAKMAKIVVELKALEGKNKDFRAFEPKQFLITLHAWNDIPEVYEIVKRNDPEGEFYTWWNGEAFDIAPKRLNKGAGLKHLADQLGIDLSQTIAIGNGLNDKDMIDAAGIGVTTDAKSVQGDFYTEGSEHLGGIELVDKLLNLVK